MTDEFDVLCDEAEEAIAHAKKAEADRDVAAFYFWRRIALLRTAHAAAYLFQSKKDDEHDPRSNEERASEMASEGGRP